MAVFGLIAERHQLQSDEFVTWGALGVMVFILSSKFTRESA